MTALHETAYPRHKPNPTRRELETAYTPTQEERAFVDKATTDPSARLALMIHLKVSQCLGYFPALSETPDHIVRFLAQQMRFRRAQPAERLTKFDLRGVRHRQLNKVRVFAKLRVLDAIGRQWLAQVASTTAQTKHTVVDILNVLLEELAHHRYELPGFSVLETIAVHARELLHEQYFDAIAVALTPAQRELIDGLLVTPLGQAHSPWNSLKRDPKQPTNPEVRQYIAHVRRLQELAAQLPVVDIPAPKLKLFRQIARASDASEISEFKPHKRYAMAVIFVRARYAKTLDDAADIFIRLMQRIDNRARRKLVEHQLQHSTRADALIEQLKDLLEVVESKGGTQTPMDALREALHRDVDMLIAECEAHLAYAGKNHLPFLLALYGTARSLLLNCLEVTRLKSTSQDGTIERLLGVVLGPLRHSHKPFLNLRDIGLDPKQDMDWLSAPWKRHVFSEAASQHGFGYVHRRYFELAVLTEVMGELKSGDVFIPGGEKYDDFREQFVDDDELSKEIPSYAEVAGITTNAAAFVKQMRQRLSRKASEVNKRFPKNLQVQLVEGQLSIQKVMRPEVSAMVKALDAALSERMPPKSIVDVIIDVTRWLGLEKHFQHVAGTDTRLDDLLRRVVITVFCYGCNLGPAQTSRSIRGFNRRQIAWLNHKYVSEETLEKATRDVVNAYGRFELPGYWGSGQHASADGTKWNVYEQNLLSEYHIRYGGYGGIGYYHLSDKYIAFFAHFIPCGTHESVYLLDGLLANTSDIRPDTIHGDTQAQSYTVFAVAHLLGIHLMPRIRHIGKLAFCKPEPNAKYKHLQSLFRENVDWNLIATHFRDMLRVVVSIRLGKITASTILRRLGTYSRKNKLYFAFRELGKVLRTLFLLDFIDDEEQRLLIHKHTNRSEQFNNFVQWVAFANHGVIAENLMHEQRKVIKYGQLVANMLILHNVMEMSGIIAQLQREGWTIDAATLAQLNPFRTHSTNRLGEYPIDLARTSPPLDPTRPVLLQASS